MKFLLTFLTSLYLISCNEKPKEKEQVKQRDSYYEQLERGWLVKLAEWNAARYNDSAKWRMYCYYGTDTCKAGTKKRQLTPTPLAFLDLKLTWAHYKADTLVLLYSFLFDDSTEVLYTNKGYAAVFGVEFNVRKDTVIGYEHGHGSFWERGPNVRYENFNHPDLLRFTKQNQSRLHPWFRKEAVRRGLLM